MHYRDRILMARAECECQRNSRSVIRAMQAIRDTTSGDDSGLQPAWDEACAQVQTEFSWAWGAHVATMVGLIAGRVSRPDPATAAAIWLQTEAASDWDANEEPQVPVIDDDIVNYVLEEYVLRAAWDWHNRRIERYLYRG